MPGEFKLLFLDYSKESSAFSMRGVTMDAGNFVAQTALQVALADAIADVVLGTLIKTSTVASVVKAAAIPPADKTAQVESKWLVSAVDNVTGQPVTATIPTANPDFVTNNTDLMDLAGAEGAALKAAIEDYGRSIAGNAITVTEIRLVGRNL